MNSEFEYVVSGTITSSQGFLAGAVQSGIKVPRALDLAIVYSEVPCVAVGVFTTNAIKAAPVVLSQKRLQDKSARAVVVNSGCANACTGTAGMADAEEMTGLVAEKLALSSEDVIVASTGVIGVSLPMERVRDGIGNITFIADGGHELARAIMTTDTFTKETAIFVKTETGGFTIGGVAKGAGMIHPNMATMLCFLTTDASVDADFLEQALQKAVDASFNMITVDGDTSPSDMVVLIANGLAGNRAINKDNGGAFQMALDEVCLYLAKCIARDGEGATKLIEVTVECALDQSEARLAARTIAGSSLVKAAIYGSDPNWGRIVAAIGRSGAQVDETRLDLYLNNVCVVRQGHPESVDVDKLAASLDNKEVFIRLNLNLGGNGATAWGCDLSEEYVTINSAYTT